MVFYGFGEDVREKRRKKDESGGYDIWKVAGGVLQLYGRLRSRHCLPDRIRKALSSASVGEAEEEGGSAAGRRCGKLSGSVSDASGVDWSVSYCTDRGSCGQQIVSLGRLASGQGSVRNPAGPVRSNAASSAALSVPEVFQRTEHS